jgi:Fic-DOC domain mobile mystery protein B
MGLNLDHGYGQTPLDPNEIDGLLIPAISTREELNEFEQQNIEQAILWSIGLSFKKEKILTEEFIRKVHKQMFNDVWEWAGEFRKINKNLGVDKWKITADLKCLIDDTLYWVANRTYAPDEISIRFKHRLVSIHCFSNGNGRHSRLMADIIADKIFNRPVFTWGSENRAEIRGVRQSYLNAIKAADQGDIKLLLAFSRS